MTAWARDRSPGFLGRDTELAALAELLALARAGGGAALVVHGEPGTGKTALLDRTALLAAGFRIARLTGIESESNLPFAAVQRLVEPDLALIDRLPEPQRRALLVAIGHTGGQPPDRFLAGLAVLSLLCEVARTRPLLCLVDDVQWLDQESRDALAFAARRLGDVAIVIVVAGRPGSIASLDGLDTVELAGLERADALHLLRQVLRTRLPDVERPAADPRIADEIVSATGGNPLALVELGHHLSMRELAGDLALAEPMPVGPSLEQHYLGLVRGYPESTCTWLLIAAAEPAGDPRYVTEAAFALALPGEASRPAERDRLVSTGAAITFRHPLVRSAVYRGATGTEVRRVHAALAKVTSNFEDGDRRAWHLAAAAVGHDEYVAGELAAASARAGQRGGYAARALFLTRAAELTAPGPLRAVRTVEAAEAATLAGSPVRALALLDHLAELDEVSAGEPIDPAIVGRGLTSRAVAEKFAGVPLAAARAPARCVEAARAFQIEDPAAARDALLAAFDHALGAEWMMADLTLDELADEALAATGGDVPDLMLRALGELASSPDSHAVPAMRAAVDALLDSPTEADVLRCGTSVVSLTTALWDDSARVRTLRTLAEAARRHGALQVLDTALWVLGVCETVHGQLDTVDALVAEVYELREAVGLSPAQARVFPNAELLAWRGPDSPQLRAELKASGDAATYLGLGGAQTMARTGAMLLDLAAGDYTVAYATAAAIQAEGFMQICIRGLPDLIEAAVRSAHPAQAQAALERLDDIASASRTPWGLGVLERGRGLLAEASHEDQAAAHYQHAIALLSRTRARADLARTHLLYGEWLRRRRRRTEAAHQLGRAIEIFDTMGAEPFASRARRELAATGASVAAGMPGIQAALTAQERAVAELAVTGATNAEIGATLFISSNTVAFHLRKVFRKLDVSSRRQLAAALRRTPAP